jgi:hypothetical protein
MRVSIIAALLVFAAVPSMAQQAEQRSIPSICVGCNDRPSKAVLQKRGREAERTSRARRHRAAERRIVVPRLAAPRRGATQNELGSINRSLQQQQESTRASQQLQFEMNQMRQNSFPEPIRIRPDQPGCPAGSIGC